MQNRPSNIQFIIKNPDVMPLDLQVQDVERFLDTLPVNTSIENAIVQLVELGYSPSAFNFNPEYHAIALSVS